MLGYYEPAKIEKLMTEKKRERFYLDLFQLLYKSFPHDDIKHIDEPDFLIKEPSRNIGIEVTRLFHNTQNVAYSQKAQEKERSAITEIASKLCKEKGVPPLLVAVFFRKDIVLRKSRRSVLGSELAEIVVEHLPKEGEYISLKNTYGTNASFPKEIDFIKINRVQTIKEHDWFVPEAGFVGKDFAKELQTLLDKKHTRLPTYLQKCDRCWLLVVADGDSPSSNFPLSPVTLNRKYQSFFEHVFFLEVFSRKLIELSIYRGANV